MKVKETIEKLSKFDPEMLVKTACLDDIEEIEVRAVSWTDINGIQTKIDCVILEVA